MYKRNAILKEKLNAKKHMRHFAETQITSNTKTKAWVAFQSLTLNGGFLKQVMKTVRHFESVPNQKS